MDKGRTVDFRNTVVIMTSNLGNTLWENGHKVGRDEITRVSQAHFRPEFLNRIDEIVALPPARQRTPAPELWIFNCAASANCWPRRDYNSKSPKPPANTWGRNRLRPGTFSARPLKRAIQRELGATPLALKVLAGEFKEGDTIRVDRCPTG